MSKLIEITVSPKGETKIETRGFTGSACREASAFLEKAMGARTGERLTAEFHQQQTQTNSLHEGQT